MMDKGLSVSRKDHFRLLNHLLMITCVTIAMGIYMYISDVLSRGPATVLFAIWMFNAATALYLHWEYYKYEKNAHIFIDSKNRCLFYSNDGINTSIPFEKIIDITMYLTYPMSRKSTYALPYSFYYYGKITMDNDEFIIITTLITADLEEELSKIPDIKIKKEISLFTSIGFTI